MKKEYLKNQVVRDLLYIGAVDATDRKVYVGDFIDFIGDGMVVGSRETGRILIENGVVMVNGWKIFGDNPAGVHNHSMVYLNDSYVID